VQPHNPSAVAPAVRVPRDAASSPYHDCIEARRDTNMNDAKPKPAVEVELKQLETGIDALAAVVAQLQEENRALRQRMDSMMTERATLLQKNEQVRARVEAMIGRLKAMEHSA
jgi:cell division protein ZapB